MDASATDHVKDSYLCMTYETCHAGTQVLEEIIESQNMYSKSLEFVWYIQRSNTTVPKSTITQKADLVPNPRLDFIHQPSRSYVGPLQGSEDIPSRPKTA